MSYGRKLIYMLLSVMLIIALLPASVFAAVEDGLSDDVSELESDMKYGEGLDEASKDIIDADQLADEFFMSNEGSDSSVNGPGIPRSLSVKGDRLSGMNLTYYKKYRTIISEVAAGKRNSTVIRVKLSKILGKSTFTARELGVSRIVKNGAITSAVNKKINRMLLPEDWKKISKALMSDLVGKDYWVDWYGDENWVTYNAPFTAYSNKITFRSSAVITFAVPVSSEFAKSYGSSKYYIYKADKSKIKKANTAKKTARAIVREFDNAVPVAYADYSPETIDAFRLWYYCRVIASLTDYDYNASARVQNNQKIYNNSPWNMINVFDQDGSTNAVCEGYAKAFKYLCDLSKFKSDWIDCQIVSGKAGESHMWNIVRMNDGCNYLVDPTWLDAGDDADEEGIWFLRGSPSGTADAYTIEGIRRVYDARTKSVFAPAERRLSKNDYYQFGSDKKITLKGTAIKKLKKGKRSFNVSWNKVSTPLGALYVDGYQIQYGLKSNFKGAKTVKVKGYNKASRKIGKLKSNKKYYVRIRSYAKMGKHTYYSAWSKRKAVRTR